MWTTAAPASAAPGAASAISSGDLGRYGVCSGVVRLPVTAQVMKTFSLGARIVLLRSECSTAIDDDGGASRECQLGRTGEDDRSDVLWEPDSLEWCCSSDFFIELGTAARNERR